MWTHGRYITTGLSMVQVSALLFFMHALCTYVYIYIYVCATIWYMTIFERKNKQTKKKKKIATEFTPEQIETEFYHIMCEIIKL